MLKSVEKLSIEALRQEFRESKELKFSCLESFGNGERDRFINTLQERAREPYKIAQSSTSLCGPAAFLHCVATRRQGTDDYERYVLELATRGVGKLGNLTVKPGRACRDVKTIIERINPKSNETERIPTIAEADWIALASLRDPANALSSMNCYDSEGPAITFSGDMIRWFEKTGWHSSVGNFTRYRRPEGLSHLLDINMRSSGHICLLVNAEILINPAARFGPKKWRGIPNHWIVLNSRISLGNKTPLCGKMLVSQAPAERQQDEHISFSYWTWGSRGKACIPMHAPAAQFLAYYYGYISAAF